MFHSAIHDDTCTCMSLQYKRWVGRRISDTGLPFLYLTSMPRPALSTQLWQCVGIIITTHSPADCPALSLHMLPAQLHEYTGADINVYFNIAADYLLCGEHSDAGRPVDSGNM